MSKEKDGSVNPPNTDPPKQGGSHMADSTSPDNTQTVSGNQVATPSELLEGQAKWWEERAEQSNSDFGFYGRDLRNQEDLLKTVLGMEQDITFLLRYVRSLTELIDLASNNPEANTSPANPPTISTTKDSETK